MKYLPVLFLTIFLMPPSFSGEIKQTIADLQEGKWESVSLYSSAANGFIEINDASDFLRKLFSDIRQETLKPLDKPYNWIKSKLKIKMNNGTSVSIRFGKWWNLIINDEYIVSTYTYDSKIALFELVFLARVLGESDHAPRLPDGMRPELREFLSIYFKDLRADSPVTVKRLAFMLDHIGQDQSLLDDYAFYDTEDKDFPDYCKKLIAFLTAKKYDLSFDDYLGIVWPRYQKNTQAPMICSYPDANPAEILGLFNEPDNIERIETAPRDSLDYRIKTDKNEILRLSGTFTQELFRFQMPSFTYSLYLPRVKIRLVMKSGKTYLVSVTKDNTYKYWGIFKSCDEKKPQNWVFYAIRTDKSAEFDKIYDEIVNAK